MLCHRSSVGCPSRADDPLHLPDNVFTRLTGVIGCTREYYSFYFTRLFHCSYHFVHRDAVTDHPTELGSCGLVLSCLLDQYSRILKLFSYAAHAIANP